MVNAQPCLIKERVDEFVITRYIETSIRREIMYADFDRSSLNATIPKEYHREHVHAFLLTDVSTRS